MSNPARDYALFQLDRQPLPGWPEPSSDRKWRVPEPTDPRDKALAEQLYVGVVKNLLSLRRWMQIAADRAPNRIDPLVQKILSIGLYQLRHLDRIPTSAAVDQAVEQAKTFDRAAAAGFVNAVLRKAADAPQPLNPSKSEEPHAYAVQVLSHPRDLFQKLLNLLGRDDAIRFCEHDNAEPPTLARLNPPATIEQLATAGVTISPHSQPGIVVVENAKRSTFSQWSERGHAQVQDATAAAVAASCDVRPGMRVLDRCCGVGTKTLQLRDLAGTDGFVAAVDPSGPRCQTLRATLADRDFENVKVIQTDMIAKTTELAGETFDRVLVDVPCSNSGVLARRPEARYAQSPENLKSLRKLQLGILNDTVPAVSPGGLLIYSTCSVWPEENEGVVAQFLKDHPEFEQLSSRSTWPSLTPDPAGYHDGGFHAVLRQNG